MESRWSQTDAAAVVREYGEAWGEALALRTYASRLLGAEPALVLHGGGNTSVKATRRDVLGAEVPAIYVKASGRDLAVIEPDGHTPLDLAYLKELQRLERLSDEAMFEALLTHRLVSEAALPSLEALLHVFIDQPFIDHTHADAILALTNRAGG
jgi:rhamnose utilization protein RhaD (predicted bifunctional aldolase and dehydrogenase)